MLSVQDRASALTTTSQDAPFSASRTRACIDAFSSSFDVGAVLWRATSRPGDGLNYRFYERYATEAADIATDNGLLKQTHPLIPLLESWSAKYDLNGNVLFPQQSCDFDADEGLHKIWVYMSGFRDLESVLGAEHVPPSVKQLAPTFHELGLKTVRHVAVDFYSNTVNLYFRVCGPVTESLVSSLTDLVASTPPSADQIHELETHLNLDGFTFGLTILPTTGEIKRVAFYALGLSETARPSVGDRLTKFFDEAPDYDEEEFRAVAWSYGKGGEQYVKGEKSYCGRLMEVLRGWNTILRVDMDVEGTSNLTKGMTEVESVT